MKRLNIEDIIKILESGGELYVRKPICVFGEILDVNFKEISVITQDDINMDDLHELGDIIFLEKGLDEIIDIEIDIEDVFENREDVEHAHKYTNISNPNTLSLPFYEDFINNPNERYTIKIDYSGDDEIRYTLRSMSKIRIWKNDGKVSTEIFSEPHSRDNYKLACQMAKDIFKGNLD